MMKLAIVSIVSILATSAGIARADDPPESSAGGARLGISAGGMYLNANGSETGYGANAWIGYEIDRGSLAYTPMLDVGYAYFSSTDNSPSANLIYVIPTLQIALHEGPWIPALEVGVGYGHVSSGPDFSDEYLALSVGAELEYQFTPRLAIGVVAHYKPFLELALNTFVDFGLNATIAL